MSATAAIMNTRLAKILMGQSIPDRFIVTGDEPAWVYEWKWGGEPWGYGTGRQGMGYEWTGMDFASVPAAEKWIAEREEQERSERELTRLEAAE